ncbi:cupin domain-containing protein [SAR116 cluster bacterium]|nr:cupin domain-containing protein [SAR116 cluster bacterium]
MTVIDLNQRIVRYGDLVPCRTAFIDAHTPGSNQKENFTIIGGGVSESADQHVHIADTPGFNIGAAGQPPKVRNSLHAHRTAEVFFVLSGRWRFFWGVDGTDGEVVLQEGDVINLPTGIFRGFENIGTDYAMIMAVLGGDDAGGGVVWAPQVIEEAREHGLVLAENGALYDSKKGEELPSGIGPMPVLTPAEMAQFPVVTSQEFVQRFVARYWDMMAMADGAPASVIADDGMLRDLPGFRLDLIRAGSLPPTPYVTRRHEVLMVMRGHWRVRWGDGSSDEASLSPGDVCAIPPNTRVSLEPSMSGEASLFRVIDTDDIPGGTVDFHPVPAALAQ